ncbi:hypothetical protein J3459_015273 [Metarhizium acridum]|uniref:Uncharacterized protein n=1 Tax=Metarhizium acridum (strain CQMa 102) TaxID=655827 RepID=E9DUZ3_METAQ|nr:uncharacterized protein MAC_01526 [Metarhizium acridum CQMa 102]EFY92560.1 hypothetical protein MAC_01526 [Metarhizium acridum CQMa 102]KAG8413528.1 hypothetical protein J3459_015273 [Metarhizium acridum]KAG8413991.1 hypothetical protein J3458_011646 [Metarhizium acridum]
MRFLRKAFTLVAFSALVANVLGAPVETVKRGDYEDSGDLARHAVDLDGLNEHLALSTVPFDARNDVDSLVKELAKPPTEKDFRDYLTALNSQPGYVNYTQKLVFWSGATEAQAQAFATQNQRFTVGMLIQRKMEWEIYKKPKSEGGHWKDWDETFKMFWDPISKVMAELARAHVYAYFTEARAAEQKDITRCLAVWCRIEKRILIDSLNARPARINSILKFILYKDGTTKPAGLIEKIMD